MKFRLIKYRGKRLSLKIEKRYVSNKPIISIGCDCHPAHVINSLHLRTVSFPFDWLNTTPSKGINYINKNIKDNFSLFLSNLKKNDRGYVVSSNYPDSEFFHFPDLIDSQEAQSMMRRRYRRFLDYFNSENCFLLFNVTSHGLESSSDASLFIESVKEFHELSNGIHSLLVYIRYDESLHENQTNCDAVEKELGKLKQTSVVKYIRYKNDHGIWGSKDSYCSLLKSLGVKLKLGFPKIYLSRA